MLVSVVLIMAVAAAVGIWAIGFAISGRAVILRQLIVAGVVEASLVIQGVVLAGAQLTGTQVGDPITLWGYILVALLMMPGAAVVAFVERSRWSSVVLAFAALTVIVMEMRIWQVWQG